MLRRANYEKPSFVMSNLALASIGLVSNVLILDVSALLITGRGWSVSVGRHVAQGAAARELTNCTMAGLEMS